jgi:DNA-directed RNA polymerase specialized sigma24 family protein
MAYKTNVSRWLARTVRDNRDKRDRKIKDMWLECHTQERIAETCGCSVGTVNEIADKFFKSVQAYQNEKATQHALHVTDFEPPRLWP